MEKVRLFALVQLIIFLLLLPLASYAGGEEQSAQSVQEKFSTLIQNRQQEGKQHSGNLPERQSPYAPSGVKLNEENRAIQQQAVKAYFQHVMQSNQHQLNVFHWQLLSAKIIFVVVILLVAAGIYFAAVQFHHGLRSGNAIAQDTEIEASLKGIKVSSPVLGVIILTISLAFFYLYLVYVYPIEFVRG